MFPPGSYSPRPIEGVPDLLTIGRSARTAAGATSIEIAPPASLGRAHLDRLQEEGWRTASTPCAAALTLISAEFSPDRVKLDLLPVADGAIRLDALFASFAAFGSPFGSAISAWLIVRLAERAALLHRAGLVAPLLDRSAVLIAPDGTPSILSFGQPGLDAIFRAPGAPPMDRDPGTFDPRDDVRALGVLYCELLSGRAHVSRSLPDPRPELVEVLKRSLAADRDQRFSSLESFGAAVEREAQPLINGGDPRTTLAGLIRDWTLPGTPRGPLALIAPHLERQPALDVIGAPLIPHAIPKNEIPLAPSADALEDWSAALGEQLDRAVGPDRTRAPAPAKSGLSLPAAGPASTPAPPKPEVDISQLIEAVAGSRRTKPLTPFEAQRAAQRTLFAKLAVVAASFMVFMIALAGYFVFSPKESGPVQPNALPPEAPNTTYQPPAEDKRPEEKAAPERVYSTIMSQPLGADVELDGGFIGKTPVVIREKLTKPSYQLIVSKPGYKPWTREVYRDTNTGAFNIMAILESAN